MIWRPTKEGEIATGVGSALQAPEYDDLIWAEVLDAAEASGRISMKDDVFECKDLAGDRDVAASDVRVGLGTGHVWTTNVSAKIGGSRVGRPELLILARW